MFCPFAANSSCVADSRTWPMLPGRRLELQREHRLDRVDDDEAPDAGARSPRGSARGRSRPGCRAAPARHAEPLAARLDLVLGLFARAVEHRARPPSRSAPPPAAAASTCRCPARRRSAPAIRARRRRRARDRTRRCRSRSAPRRRCRCRRRAAARRPRPGCSAAPAAAPAVARSGNWRSSTSEFHAPQSAQRPSHFGRLRAALLTGEDCLRFHSLQFPAPIPNHDRSNNRVEGATLDCGLTRRSIDSLSWKFGWS